MSKINIPNELTEQLRDLRCQTCGSAAVEPKLYYVRYFLHDDDIIGDTWLIAADCMKCEHEEIQAARIKWWMYIVASSLCAFVLGWKFPL